jgi:CO/xanthine dehydrogenase Mo-binding subunit
VIDVGKVINPDAMRSMIMGGMAMGISMASREAYTYDEHGILCTPNLRTYKLLHIGQEPQYRVEFVETPLEDSPYGVRCYSEHGIIGIPAALGNALSTALGRDINQLPLKPELLWSICTGGNDDTD